MQVDHVFTRRRTPILRLLLPLLVSSLWFPARCQDGELFDPQAHPVIDFSVPGEEVIDSVDEVISGVFLLYGEISNELMNSGDLDIVVREMLGKVCKHFTRDAGAPVLSKMYMDVTTLGLERIGINYTWQMLPPVEAGSDCINRLAMVAFGPKEPPFDELPPPPMRELFSFEMKMHEPTRWLDMTDWGLVLQNMSCYERRVIKHWNHTKSIDVWPTEEPECLGADSIDWEPNLLGEFEVDNVGQCALAGSQPCTCAALPGCEWIPTVEGFNKCVYTSNPGVSCDACTYQSKCVITPQKVCAAKSTPCACVLTGKDCEWDMAAAKCVYDPSGITPCIACPRQYFCSLPSVRFTDPQSLSIMGAKHIGWFINVTFDRTMEFVYSGFGSGILMQCRPSVPGEWAPTFEIEYAKLSITDDMLHIDTRSLRNEKLRDCDLIVMNNAVRGTVGMLPFAGMVENTVLISLPDTVEPEVVDVFPKNSARGVSLNMTIVFLFNEKITLSKTVDLQTQRATLIRLGGNGSDIKSDKLIAEIALNDPNVVMSLKELSISLSGLLEYSKYYSITLPADVVSDQNTNTFVGLERGVYNFMTEAEKEVEQLEDNEEEVIQITYIVLSSIGGVVLLAALITSIWVCREIYRSRRRAKVQVNVSKNLDALKLAAESPEFQESNLAPETPSPVAPAGPRLAPMAALKVLHHQPLQRFDPGDGEDDDWADSVSPASQTFNSAANRSTSSWYSRQGRPTVQVYAKPDDPKVDISKQLRVQGSVISLAETHQNSASTAKSLNSSAGFYEQQKVKRPPLQASHSPTAKLPMSPTMSPHSSPKAHRGGRGTRGTRTGGSPARGQSQARLGWQSPSDGKAPPIATSPPPAALEA